jgi:hypothetical protein
MEEESGRKKLKMMIIGCGQHQGLQQVLFVSGRAHQRILLIKCRRYSSPHSQSAIAVPCNYSQLLGSLTCPCKLLRTLVIHTLKRLASAVQLRPWPPCFKAVTLNQQNRFSTRSVRIQRIYNQEWPEVLLPGPPSCPLTLGMSSLRSRRGGIRIGKTCRR